MLRRGAALALVLFFLLGNIPVAAESLPGETLDHMVISEVMAGTTANSNDEFIELYNPTTESIDLTGWSLEKAVGSLGPTTTWDALALPAITLNSESFLLLCRSGGTTVGCDGTFSFSLAYSGGHLRLLRPDDSTPADMTDTVQVDLVGWGNATQPEGWVSPADPVAFAAPTLIASSSLERKISIEGEIQDNDHNLNDFLLSDTPTPDALPPLPPPDPDPDPEPEPEPDPEPVNYPSITINEILSDPVSPKVDAEDEFIELYNPSDHTISLKDYIIQTGSSLQYRYTIPNRTVAAKGYLVLYAHTTNLTLSNSGSHVQILAPDNTVAASLVSYGDSPAGESWARFSSRFSWTDRVTPGSPNQAHSPPKSTTTSSSTRVTTTTRQASYPRITITEVFPDPDSPQKDAEDEFVELYNPNNTSVNLDGYKIKSGSSLKTSETIDNITIKPKSYIAIFNRDATLSLTNAGGTVALLDPNGKEIFRIGAYPKAQTGASWAMIAGKWQWTGKPTPAAANAAQAIVSEGSGSSSNTALNSSGSANTNGLLGPLAQPAALPSGPPNWRLIAGVGIATTLYMAYESRHDIRNWIYRWDRYREVHRSGK